MRCKPTIIGIGEARDAETIGTLVEAALTGHGAYATMHTDSVAETISRAIQVFRQRSIPQWRQSCWGPSDSSSCRSWYRL
ncbi:ATPase, T2SS/T4P/T4SS family [Cupriavidus basilensis]